MKKFWSLDRSGLTGITPQTFFIIIAAIFGVAFILITPPFEAPDEPVHFFRAYQISEGNLSVDKIGNTYGGELPQSIAETITKTYDQTGVAFHPDIKYSVSSTRNTLHIHNTHKNHLFDFSTTAYYSPISYIPQAVGIGVTRLMNAPPIISLYFGRLCNLAAWIALFYLAIRLMPYRKWAVVFIGLLPMALFQAASMSADVMAIGLLAVTLALILRFASSTTRLTSKQLIALTTLLTLLALSKQVMFLFAGLVLLLPKGLFKSQRLALASKAILITVPLLLFAIWSMHVKGITFSSSVNGIDPTQQERYVLHNPFEYLNVLFNTYFYSWSDGIVKSFIGNFGWVDAPLADTIVVPAYVALFLVIAASTGKTKQWLSGNQKILLGLIAIVYLLAVSTALYAYSTPVAFKIVVGLVGRYYIPVALLLIPILTGNWLVMSRKAYRRLAMISPVLLLVCSVITLYVRYYINNV